MRPTLAIIRVLGIMAGVYLVYSAIYGTQQLFAQVAWSPFFEAGPLSFHYFAPTLFLGIMLLLPWSRLRSPPVWIVAFAILLVAFAAYLWRYFWPFTYVLNHGRAGLVL